MTQEHEMAAKKLLEEFPVEKSIEIAEAMIDTAKEFSLHGEMTFWRKVKKLLQQSDNTKNSEQ